jgi:hypothetical protein
MRALDFSFYTNKSFGKNFNHEREPLEYESYYMTKNTEYRLIQIMISEIISSWFQNLMFAIISGIYPLRNGTPSQKRLLSL